MSNGLPLLVQSPRKSHTRALTPCESLRLTADWRPRVKKIRILAANGGWYPAQVVLLQRRRHERSVPLNETLKRDRLARKGFPVLWYSTTHRLRFLLIAVLLLPVCMSGRTTADDDSTRDRRHR